MKQKINIWEGVYNCWEEAPGDDDVFEGKVWVDKVTSRAQKALAAYRSNETVSRAALNKDYILSVAGAMLLPSIDGNLCVLDFGGGMGASYLPLISSVPDFEKVEFHIVEGKIICERGRETLGDFANLHFHEQLPQDAGNGQYTLEWQGYTGQMLITVFDDYGVPHVDGEARGAGERVHPTQYNGYTYRVVQSGTLGVEPVWPTTADETVWSGTVQLIAVPFYRPVSEGPFIV